MTSSSGQASAVTPLLQAQNLSKRFGGLVAVNDVSLSLFKDQLHAVIGPNGAGKTTLTHLLSGDVPASSGRLKLKGTDVTGWPHHRLSLHGLGRSYQKTNVFLPLTVWDNLMLAAQAHDARAPFNPLSWFTRADQNPSVVARADRALNLAGLTSTRNKTAAILSHGIQRQLEIAMVLATEPEVLLLDEPLAGMGAAEAETMVQLLQTLKKDHAMLLIEHDMDAVFALAEVLTVMVNGTVIATGSPEAIRGDAKVQAAYLGEATP
jgi:branched-chain amino acid transport system ATP-binding protein